MKKLLSCIAALFTIFTIVSCLQEERSPEEILVPSPAEVDCSEASLMLTSKVPSGSEKLVYECGFLVGPEKPLTDADRVKGTLSSNYFSASFPVREYGTTYYMCAYVTNGHGSEIRSDMRSYELMDLEDYVEFGSMNLLSYDMSSKQASVTIDADIWKGVNVTEVGVCYGMEPTALSIEGECQKGTYDADEGVVSILLDGFLGATQYYLRPYLKDGDYLVYGEIVSLYIPSTAKVETLYAEDITSSGVTLVGEVTDECGSPVTERGFVWVEGDAVPTLESNRITSGSGIGVMTAEVEGLSQNKKYTFRAYAINASGTAYGDPKSFTTLVAIPLLGSSAVSNITSVSATFNGTLIDDGGESVSEVGFYYSTDKDVEPETSQKVAKEYSSYQKSAKEFNSKTLYSAMQSAQNASDQEGEPFMIDVFNLSVKTKYYVKSYATNSAGTAYGAVVSFETAGEVATIKTVGSSEVTTKSAVLTGNIISDNGEKIIERGFVWMEGSGTPAADSNKLKVEGETGEFTATLDGLDPNKKYSFRAYAINAEGTAYGEVMTFTTSVALPTLSAVVVSSISSTAATLSSTITYHGGETVTEVGFYYSTESEFDHDTALKVSSPYSADTFSIEVAELAINTQYYVKAYAINSAGIAYSEVNDFKTSSSSPSVKTLGASEVTPESAVLSGTVLSDNGSSVTERGIVWLQGYGTPTTDSYKVMASGTLGDFSVTLSDLDPNKKYSFRAYAINAKGTAYGELMTFSTVAGLPVLSSVDISEITTVSAIVASTVTDHGGDVVSEVGFYYSTEEAVDSTTSPKVAQQYAKDQFTLPINDLSAGTKYYVKSYATNSSGTAFSVVCSFVTLASAPSVTTVGASDITAASAVLSGVVESSNGEEITERGFLWLRGEGTPTADSQKLIVSGTTGDFNATLSDLLPNQKYSFCAYAVNSKGTAYGETMSFTTSVAKPSLDLVTFSSITATSATLSSKVTSHGGATVTEVGFYYSTEESVDPEKSLKVNRTYTSDSFSISLSELSINTKYYVKAYAVNSAGTVYSDVASFTTLASTPVVKTVGSSEVTSTSAVLSGTVVTDNGATITERGFVWLKGSDAPTTSSNKVKVEGTTGDFTATISGLSPNQKYSFRAYAVNTKGTSYGDVKNLTTLPALPEVEIQGVFEITSTTAEIDAKVTYDGGETPYEAGFFYGTTSNLDPATASKVIASGIGDGGSYYYNLSDLKRATQYYIKPYATNSAGTAYGDVEQFKTLPELPYVTTTEVTDITETTAKCGGVITDDGGEVLSKGIVWSRKPDPTIDLPTKTEVNGAESSFTGIVTDLSAGFPYYVRAYVTNSIGTTYGEQKQFTAAGEILSVPMEPANSFIISSTDYYSFSTVKGNSYESVGPVASAEVLWESFGTDETPEVGSLIPFVLYKNDKITFAPADPYREGNAVIAAKDASGTILWSWHIWLTDQPQEQVYYNHAGTMMDRNLGATSAIPGDVGALGLFYQWGRKDPFLGSSSITSSSSIAKSTITWPSPVSIGGVDYTTSHPTTEVLDLDFDNTSWQSEKTIYDPCPIGWRVPDGGEDGVWLQALGSQFYDIDTFDSINKGINFSGKLGSDIVIWYPASGLLGSPLRDVGDSGHYWSVTVGGGVCHAMGFGFGPDSSTHGFVADVAFVFSVRCFKEGTGGEPQYDNDFSTSGVQNLSDAGTANSYIVSTAGTYSISPVKGNSSEPVGPVSSAEVLWETFGTDQRVLKGDLISGAKYENGLIYFETADTYREGNAVIAAKDASGTILWSWHIWLTDQPQGQEYYNNAGTMMDRNLGATSATPGDVGALGLLYQWGRKDPFLGSSSISSSTLASSTITWPSMVSSDSSNGTIEYATANPTTFITDNDGNHDWYYTGSDSTDDTRWQSDKTIYDPCPAGWRVPDGGDNGIWINAFRSSPDYTLTYDSVNDGMDFSGYFGLDPTIWYPASGFRYRVDGALYNVGHNGCYWSVNPYLNPHYYYNAHFLYILEDGCYSSYEYRAQGFGVRCFKEGTGGGPQYDNDISTSESISLSDAGTANSYIVSNAGTYSIKAVKGNSTEPVGSVASAEVLWESFGTDEKVFKGNLVSGARYENGKIYFKTADSYREGNAVIAAKDASGTILWSWHIWLTDEPQGQVYNNDAGTMMDRNLGATSAMPGDVGALGLLYQWGRKDPFLGSSSISGGTEAKSTLTWPSAVSSDSSNGTIDYAIEHPTTFILRNSNNHDWYYTGSYSTDNTRWQSEKTIYDPCPSGWRVPNGGDEGVWSTAKGSSSSYDRSYDSTNKGMNFSGDFGSASTIWYPASGLRLYDFVGALDHVGRFGSYWSVTPDGFNPYYLGFDSDGYVGPAAYNNRALGFSVRCLQESE